MIDAGEHYTEKDSPEKPFNFDTLPDPFPDEASGNLSRDAFDRDPRDISNPRDPGVYILQFFPISSSIFFLSIPIFY